MSITKEQMKIVYQVLAMYSERKYSQEQIAKVLGISLNVVRNITQKRGYSHGINRELMQTPIECYDNYSDCF